MLKDKDGGDTQSKKAAIDSIENLKHCKYTWGTLNVEKFMKRLAEEGIRDAKLEQSASGSIIHLVRVFIAQCPSHIPGFLRHLFLQQNEDTLIQIEDDSTHICCASLEKGFRTKLKNILLSCLNQF